MSYLCEYITLQRLFKCQTQIHFRTFAFTSAIGMPQICAHNVHNIHVTLRRWRDFLFGVGLQDVVAQVSVFGDAGEFCPDKLSTDGNRSFFYLIGSVEQNVIKEGGHNSV